MKNRWGTIAGMLCAVLTLISVVGCGQKTSDKGKTDVVVDSAETKGNEFQSNLDVIRPQAYSTVDGLKLEKGSYISVIGKADGSEYWKAVKAGAEQAVKDMNETLGYQNEDKIKVSYSGPNKADSVNEQINILDEELARYPLAVGIAAVDATACTVQFDLAAENNIPIITFDSGSDYKNVASKCSTDNTAAAQTAAVKLSDAIEDEGEIVVFVHDAQSMTGIEREKAFVDEIKRNQTGIKVVKIYYMDEHEAMAKQIAQEKSTPTQVVDAASITPTDVVKYILEKSPNIKGCFATNVDATQVVIKACEESELEDIKIVGFDGGEDQLKALEDGKVSGLIVQNPYGMGYATVVAAARAVLDVGNEAAVDTGYTWVTKSNMDKKSIQRMLY